MEVGVRKRRGRGIKAVLEREMYRRGGGAGGGPWTREQRVTGAHLRPGQCQGALAAEIHVSLSRDKTAVPVSRL